MVLPGLGGALDRGHEPVVADAVLHDELGRLPFAGDRGRASNLCGSVLGLDIMRGLDVLAADLADRVGVLVLGADRDDLA